MGRGKLIALVVGVAAVVAIVTWAVTFLLVVRPEPRPLTSGSAPSSAAGTAAGIQVVLEHLSGAAVDESGWRVHGGFFEFTVKVTGPGEQTKGPLTVDLSLPTSAMNVTGVVGDQWQCQDVDTGLKCTNANVVAPLEAWPVLTVRALQTDYAKDSIDAYVSGPGEAHAGVPIFLDTSL